MDLIGQILLLGATGYLSLLLLLAGFSKVVTAGTNTMRSLGVVELILGMAITMPKLGPWPASITWLLFSAFLLKRIGALTRPRTPCHCFGAFVTQHEDVAAAVGTGAIWWVMASGVVAAAVDGAFGEAGSWKFMQIAYVAAFVTIAAFAIYGRWIRPHRGTGPLKEADEIVRQVRYSPRSAPS